MPPNYRLVQASGVGIANFFFNSNCQVNSAGRECYIESQNPAVVSKAAASSKP